MANITYHWDLRSIYPSLNAWESDLQRVHELLLQVEAYKNCLGESASSLYEGLQLVEVLEELTGNLYIYAHLLAHQEMPNAALQSLAARASSVEAHVYEKISFVTQELIQLEPATMEQYLQEYVGLRPYRKKLERLIRQKEHMLTPAEEELLASVTELTDVPGNIFNLLLYADLQPGAAADSNGAEHEVSESRIRGLLEQPDRLLRKRAYQSLLGTYRNFRNTLTATYSASVKKNVLVAKARRYRSALEMAMEKDSLTPDVYYNLIGVVRDHRDGLQRYLELRKRVLQLSELGYYDLFVSLTGGSAARVPYEQAEQWVLEALQPLGKEYVAKIRQVFSEGWIDVYPRPGKRSGAYSWGTPSSHPYILLNYNDTLFDLFTLVHELGHALHSAFSFQTQPLAYAQYSSFIGEVASTLNEHLLLETLLVKASDPKERAYLLLYSLEQYRTTLFRQTMLAEFELFAHERIARAESLTVDDLSEQYGMLNADYYGSALRIDEELKMEWARIPQFYSGFYVYKYATGFAASAALSRQVLTEGDTAAFRVLDFLRSGSSEDPLPVLKRAGVDLSAPEPIYNALRVFDERLVELEQLLNL